MTAGQSEIAIEALNVAINGKYRENDLQILHYLTTEICQRAVKKASEKLRHGMQKSIPTPLPITVTAPGNHPNNPNGDKASTEDGQAAAAPTLHVQPDVSEEDDLNMELEIAESQYEASVLKADMLKIRLKLRRSKRTNTRRG